MSIYSKVPIKKPGRNAFNLSHTFRGTLNIGQIKPIARPLEAVPGDTFITGNISKVELSPIISNFFGELYFETWQFFVSNDMLYVNSDSGKFTDILASLQDPQNILPLPYFQNSNSFSGKSSWLNYLYGLSLPTSQSIAQKHVLLYPARACIKIWNEWFRDENLQTEVSLSAPSSLDFSVNYKKDRYSSAFLSTQKGTEIRLKNLFAVPPTQDFNYLFFSKSTITSPVANTNVDVIQNNNENGYYSPFHLPSTATDAQRNGLNELIVQALNFVNRGISINDLRLYNKLQKWQERNQLCGTRIKEYLLANYGITPNDETLQRPVLIGHTRVPVVIDPIVSNIQQDNITQTTPPSTAIALQNKQGSRGGIAGASSSFKYGKWLCKEFGWIITLGALRPKASYCQGIHKSLRKDSIVDFFNPIFEHLGQQEIKTSELYFDNSSNDDVIFGFQDIYNEMRHIEDFTAPDLTSDFPNKTMNRKFANAPTLSSAFIKVDPTEYDYLFAVPSSQAPQAFFTSNNIIKAIRPLSKRSTPSL